ncbi:LOW QUALITY PROTEIN: Hypothetical protein PHPALM_5911 [Phytophthora palmivora]|uniref:Uncharacterized protein n=1 Tax=Phytophthora palmivora TaxID=4796 RepID=A0A2P4YG83_9STRA|nr:LOW QUALITY PROTEIN: Hypothetical protein PHPALM_5911 [Phytophthora palmivora]
MTPLNRDRSADRQSFGRSSADETEEGPATDLEEKPLPPHRVPSETPGDSDLRRRKFIGKSQTNACLRAEHEKEVSKIEALTKKMNPPESGADDQDDLKAAWTEESLEIAYHQNELHTLSIKNPVMQIIKPTIISDLKGPVQKPTARSSKLEAGHFDAIDLFDTRLITINTALRPIFDLLKPFVERNSKAPTRTTNDTLRSLNGTHIGRTDRNIITL